MHFVKRSCFECMKSLSMKYCERLYKIIVSVENVPWFICHLLSVLLSYVARDRHAQPRYTTIPHLSDVYQHAGSTVNAHLLFDICLTIDVRNVHSTGSTVHPILSTPSSFVWVVVVVCPALYTCRHRVRWAETRTYWTWHPCLQCKRQFHVKLCLHGSFR